MVILFSEMANRTKTAVRKSTAKEKKTGKGTKETSDGQLWNNYIDPFESNDRSLEDQTRDQFFHILFAANYGIATYLPPGTPQGPLKQLNPEKLFMCTFRKCYRVYKQENGVSRHHVHMHRLCGMKLGNGNPCPYKFKTPRDIQGHTKEAHATTVRQLRTENFGPTDDSSLQNEIVVAGGSSEMEIEGQN